MTNTKGQSPCAVASYLLGQCSVTAWDVPAITPDQHYSGPQSPPYANDCLCSSVAYNLMSACGLCQQAPVLASWPTWSTNCTRHVIPQGRWTMSIPSGTSVPAWAYVTPDSMGGTFSPTIAQGFTCTFGSSLIYPSFDSINFFLGRRSLSRVDVNSYSNLFCPYTHWDGR
ncbi:hypothetical protein BOTBODRAFT_500253 [Botryobasidium botryosum FD-172 SS1]|uniref:Uncharacterized protein n=1 Tax=Botryobasidium botryosum (strain FD-172 SS1) TaxID=930990 RepID=A0A067ME90_BOTB1|nr:hypothetical protein BOTBODRAFT_500253 [Botryobasidium botryosum FD-172 SS1]